MKKALCRKCEYILAVIVDGLISIKASSNSVNIKNENINLTGSEIYFYVKGEVRIICRGCGCENYVYIEYDESRKNENINKLAILSEWTRRNTDKRYKKENT